MDEETALRRVIGLADACELLAAATAFPGDDVAAALGDGSLVADARACLADAGLGADEARAACAAWDALAGRDAAELGGALRRAHSLLHVRQGDGVAAFPYESAFRFVRDGHGGNPGLFRSPVTQDVEAQMRAAGVLPLDARTEPCDSVWQEASFASFLLGSEAAALSQGNAEDAAAWHGRAGDFLAGHLLTWLPDLLSVTARLAAAWAEEGSLPADAARYREGLGAWGAHVADLLEAHAARASR